MNSSNRAIWLGYGMTGGRLKISHDEMYGGVSILGLGAKELSALFAYSCDEANLNTLILDLQGRISEKISGYISTYELPYFFYDVMRLEDNPNIHAQLVSSAYACALDLSFEQEGMLNTAAQRIAAERGIASPASILDRINSEKFRGTTVEKVKGRLESLKSLDITGEVNVAKEVLKRSAVLDFSKARTPEAVEVAAALFIAKLLSINVKPDVVILTDANRLFRARPIFRQSYRLLATFVSAHLPKVYASDTIYGLDEHFLDTCAMRIFSSSVWNQDRRVQMLTPNMFMIRNLPFGYDEPFIPRRFEPRRGEPKTAGVIEEASPELIRLILEDVKLYESPTRESIVSYLSGEYGRELVERTIDGLQSGGYIKVAVKDAGASRIDALALTEKGEVLLRSVE